MIMAEQESKLEKKIDDLSQQVLFIRTMMTEQELRSDQKIDKLSRQVRNLRRIVVGLGIFFYILSFGLFVQVVRKPEDINGIYKSAWILVGMYCLALFIKYIFVAVTNVPWSLDKEKKEE